MRTFLFVIKDKGGLINMTNEIIKVVTFFSGIGSPEKALEKLEFFSEIDKNAMVGLAQIQFLRNHL